MAIKFRLMMKVKLGKSRFLIDTGKQKLGTSTALRIFRLVAHATLLWLS